MPPPPEYQKCNNQGKPGWVVEFLDDLVFAEFQELSRDLRVRFNRIVDLIETAGLQRILEPHVKHLAGPLWEMRLSGRDGIARGIYVTAKGRRVVVVRFFVKKTQATPRREIELALKRAKGVVKS